MTPRLPRLPPFARAALLLDLDGTLLDIAPTPDSVQVPPALPGTLRRLSTRLGGALAVISGRTVAEVDALLGAATPAVAGEHGGALRRAPGAALERPDLPAAAMASRSVTSSPMNTGRRPVKGGARSSAATAVPLSAPCGRTSQAMWAGMRSNAAWPASRAVRAACSAGPAAGASR